MPNYLVENTIPVLAVADVPASIRFYREKLGFQLDWTGDGDPPHIASVSRDGHAIMIYRHECAHLALRQPLQSLAEVSPIRPIGDNTLSPLIPDHSGFVP